MSAPFLRNIRHLSSGLQFRLPGQRRRTGEIDNEIACSASEWNGGGGGADDGGFDCDEGSDSQIAYVERERERGESRLVLEAGDWEAPPPAYSFVEREVEGVDVDDNDDDDGGVGGDGRGERGEGEEVKEEEQRIGEGRAGVAAARDDGHRSHEMDGSTETATISPGDTSSPPPNQEAFELIESNSISNTTPTWLTTPKTFQPTFLTRLPPEIWLQIASHTVPSTAASLTLTSRYLAHSIGGPIWRTLSLPQNTPDRALSLSYMDAALPDHILCHACGVFHARLAEPSCSERLRSDSSSSSEVERRITKCPVPRHEQPTIRLTPTYSLAYPLAQLVTRAHRLQSAAHGIPASALSRSWTPPPSIITTPWGTSTTPNPWTHRTLFAIEPSSGHLLLRVVSTHRPRSGGLSASEVRRVLVSRGEYEAEFGGCWHERWVEEGDGNEGLGAMLRCALGHVASSSSVVGGGQAKMKGQQGQPLRGMAHLASQCATCRPLRRCLLCPTEYLVQLKLVDQPTSLTLGRRKQQQRRRSSLNPTPSPFQPQTTTGRFAEEPPAVEQASPFTHLLTLTRYTDLGRCEGDPANEKEWAAGARRWVYEDAESELFEKPSFASPHVPSFTSGASTSTCPDAADVDSTAERKGNVGDASTEKSKEAPTIRRRFEIASGVGPSSGSECRAVPLRHRGVRARAKGRDGDVGGGRRGEV